MGGCCVALHVTAVSLPLPLVPPFIGSQGGDPAAMDNMLMTMMQALLGKGVVLEPLQDMRRMVRVIAAVVDRDCVGGFRA